MSSWGEFPLLWETVVFALKVFVRLAEAQDI